MPADPFSASAMRYLSDGLDEKLIQNMLDKEIQQTLQRPPPRLQTC